MSPKLVVPKIRWFNILSKPCLKNHMVKIMSKYTVKRFHISECDVDLVCRIPCLFFLSQFSLVRFTAKILFLSRFRKYYVYFNVLLHYLQGCFFIEKNVMDTINMMTKSFTCNDCSFSLILNMVLNNLSLTIAICLFEFSPEYEFCVHS